MNAEMIIYTHSGLWVDVGNPKPWMFSVADIAHALSNICRFGGHSKQFYSVAEHSIIVSMYSKWPVAALLHDASEAYLIDIPSPIKKHLSEYKTLEHKVMEVIANKFKFHYPLPPSIKKLDAQVLTMEKEQVFQYMPDRRRWKNGEGSLLHRVEFLTPEAAETRFLARYIELFR